MRRVVTQMIVATLLLSTLPACAKEIAEIAYELAQKEMNAEQWKQYVSNTKKRYETWSNDNAEGSIKRYLDDKTVELAPAVLHGNAKALKSLVCMLALYHEFNEPPHSRLNQFMMAHEKDLEYLLEDFSWERAATKIKERKSKFDDERKKVVETR